jgi:hypothetical protein
VFGIGLIGSIDGADDDVGIEDGREEVVGGDDDVGLDEMDGTAEGTRFSSQSISIIDEL